jgi:hypothetical protein
VGLLDFFEQNAPRRELCSLGTFPFLATLFVLLPQMCFVVLRKTCSGHAQDAGVLGSDIVKRGA